MRVSDCVDWTRFVYPNIIVEPIPNTILYLGRKVLPPNVTNYQTRTFFQYSVYRFHAFLSLSSEHVYL